MKTAESIMTCAMLLGALLVSGCAASQAPETQVAGAVRAFQTSASKFTASRREIIKARQAAINDMERETAQASSRAEHLRTVWRIAGQKDKVQLHLSLIQATEAAGEANDAFEKLLQAQKEALANADTKVKVQQDRLTAVIKALTALGAEKSIEEQARFYFQYLKETKDEIDALQKAVDDNRDKVKNKKSAPPPSRGDDQ
jgi:outer membrane murein-binding lipoprotein Lpp